jgi:hypothetical protein
MMFGVVRNGSTGGVRGGRCKREGCVVVVTSVTTHHDVIGIPPMVPIVTTSNSRCDRSTHRNLSYKHTIPSGMHSRGHSGVSSMSALCRVIYFR